ncbi:hypothetical protein A3H22_02440 [Candidatus Peribacteria bacterium RIFCSPLOWO2_12_FULL_55_15]|nr:MAG: hypothetical protein A2789_02855 [Candidatus Peribacteria bacterium RIFCSPHIGHO2_01_FULL_54_22]OGJ62891.1 MAG: hypothetical protein A3D12_01090 [Candidatus Peribacteria bacterium RIFCSPHIGHO2_02_FULL_55_24]OGJ65087.1 MAG: hypothetical protein A3E47_02020 [Candidatus Peribacteria bacterium RIFCSPHIGHO2_12_FULL_54_10]OGJ67277.1 MAG: hypothetical protein A2947_01100 [Candidatus Peribacteria bacterium RIFCSPLOWO2_01_FULL_54_110]OGJ70009.1 MAG: hypothetical protein A3H90_03605 [Candidatus Pe
MASLGRRKAYNLTIKTLLLAAGSSRRFWPLQEKFRLLICGKTILEHQIDRLRRGGCDDILCVVGTHNQEWVQGLSPTIITVTQGEKDGMRGALLAALPFCKNEPVLVVGNDFIEANIYRELLEKFLRSPHLQGILLAREVTEYFPGGYLTLDQDRITAITEKPGEGSEPSNLVNIVAHLHRDASLLLRTLSLMPPVGDDGYEQALYSLFPHYHYATILYRGPWLPLKYPWHPLQILSSLLDIPLTPQIHPSVTIHTSAVVEGNVTIEKGVRIFPHATVRGPCFIGKNTIIGNNTLLWGSSIGSSCVIGFGTEVKASILGNHVWTHSTYIGDSIIGDNVCFGAGSVVGNFRLDEGLIFSMVGQDRVQTGLKKLGTIIGDDCRIGIHVSMNPGIKIGRGSFVSAATVVTKDAPDGSFVSMKNGEMIIRNNIAPPPHPHGRLLFQVNI